MHLLEINARPIDSESNMRDFDFSKAAIQARWQAGYADACGMIVRRPWENPVDPLGRRRCVHIRSRQLGSMTALGVRRGKAALSSGCKSHPANAPAGSNRSSYGGNEIAEAFGMRVTNW